MHPLLHLAAALLPSPAQVQPAPAAPSTEVEFFDGECQDLALPEMAGPYQDQERMWVAQHGHSRAAYRLSDKRRMMAETAVFSSSAPPTLERVVAVELDESRAYLFTLTEAALYREDVTSPYAPSARTHLDLASFAATEELVDLKVDPLTSSALVLTSERVLVFSSDTAGLALVSASDTGSTAIGVPATCTEQLVVERLTDFDVAYDPSTGGLVAAVLAQLRPVGSLRAGPRIVLFCDLDSLNGLSRPRFLFGTTPPRYTYWNPQVCCPEKFGNCPTHVAQWSINDVDLRVEGPQLMLYAAGNPKVGLQRLDATNVLAVGAPLLLGAHLQHSANYVRASATPGVVHALGTEGLFTVDFNVFPGTASFLAEYCGPGGFKDAVLRQTAGGEELWVGLTRTVDATFKAFDLDPVPSIAARWPALYHSDGGVPLVLGPTLSVYMPTFGGVLRYTSSTGLNGRWTIPPSGYQPAGSFGGSAAPTEHIDISDGFDLVNNHPAHLFVANAFGGFDDFPLDSQGDPLPMVRYAPATPGSYGNDVVFVADMNGSGTPYVLTDSIDWSTGRGHLLAWRWDAATTQWTLAADASAPICNACVPSCPPTAGPYFTDTIHYQRGTAGRDFAILSHTYGVLVFDLGGLTVVTTPSMVEVGRIETCTPDAVDAFGGVQTHCYGAATSRNTLFVAFQNGCTAPLAQISAFKWDPSSGTVSHGPTAIVDNAAVSDPSWTGSFRLRFAEMDPLTGAGRLYVCGNSGQVIELEHSGGAAHDLAPRSAWQSHYRHTIQDVRVFEFPSGTRRLLVSKDSDSFAIVTPR